MAIIMRALTSTSDDEISTCLTTLKGAAAAPGSWLMHESFHVDDAASYTRPWFAWVNSLFGELVVKLSRERPHLVGIPSAREGPRAGAVPRPSVY
jgi:meiotically up-regulated gene 157 (Mug157) protein